MSLIKKEAGVSAGAVYHYFESKEALINELYVTAKSEISDAVISELDLDAPYEESFFSLWINAYYYFASKPDALSFIEQCSNSPIITEQTKAQVVTTYQKSAEFFEQGIAQGNIKPLHIDVIHTLIYGSIVSLIKLAKDQPELVNDEVIEQAAIFCWDGLIQLN